MIYLNNSSTTKPTKQVIDDFVWCAENSWHNPSDITIHGLGAKGFILNAQKQIASSINANPEEIIFTSGGSESNNWAIKGYLDNYDVDLILSTEIEHPSVYNTCLFCKDRGTRLIYIPTDNFGVVKLDYLEKMIEIHKDCKILVSIMMANNEIGTIQPIKEIANIIHKYNNACLHVDAVQSYMHVPVDVEALGIDMLSASFHKFGGFKNCGFLYVRNGIELTPLIHGGKQFNGLRAGTENVPMIYAMGNQVERLRKYFDAQMKVTKELYDYTLNKIYDACGDLCDIYLNGEPRERLYNNISLTFNSINAEQLITLLDLNGIQVSAGSACSAGNQRPSRVLKAIGFSDEEAFSTIRVSFDFGTTKNDIDIFVESLVECIKSLKMFEN